MAGRLGTLFRSKHIRGVADAYQNIGKNTVELCRNNQPQFDGALRWAQSASNDERRAAFSYVLAAVSLTARPIAPMPKLDRGALTFVRVARLLETLIGTPSGGINQQFAVAACLHAVIDEFAVPGVRVETKNISASDASAGTAADIQVMRGNRVEEAFEVTANPWRTKLATAIQVMRSADLARIHVVASADPGFLSEMSATLSSDNDVSVIDVNALVNTLLALMRKPAREIALIRLYEYLDRYQPDIARVNAYVSLLHEHGLTLGSSATQPASQQL